MTKSYSVDDLNFLSVPLLQRLLGELQVDHLKLVTPSQFEEQINRFIRNEVDVPENLPMDPNQRIQSLTFHWGHDHDFGSFKVSGSLGTRHIWLLSRFFDHFGLDPASLKQQNVLDVGCYTGGVSLLLAKMGAEVRAIDEVCKYSRALDYVCSAFGLTNVTAECRSIYDLELKEADVRMDAVFCLGVIYHLSDPILGLRRMFNVMKPGALICLESMAVQAESRICDYYGPSRRKGDFGWNWYVPSPQTLYQWLEDTGFEDIRVGNGVWDFEVTADADPVGPNRCFATARRKATHSMCQAGLSSRVL
ncbi:MAG: DUF1698 domain-containing protein [Acidobacteriota bacterium]